MIRIRFVIKISENYKPLKINETSTVQITNLEVDHHIINYNEALIFQHNLGIVKLQTKDKNHHFVSNRQNIQVPYDF